MENGVNPLIMLLLPSLSLCLSLSLSCVTRLDLYRVFILGTAATGLWLLVPVPLPSFHLRYYYYYYYYHLAPAYAQPPDGKLPLPPLAALSPFNSIRCNPPRDRF
ncbi:uncharacterized protein P884DRAFT_115972 [Thermothelomyces heterothallicus CBS 202.75]|uniref:uncharacterized protein n=1 Tax=Thermothelomyces heterothallicus CBS 202.75 TaxID=1149848 RepID=UPI003744ACF8